MVVFERPIAALVHFRKVFFPREDQLAELVKSLRSFDVLRVFSSPTIFSDGVYPVVQQRSGTTWVDLSKSPEAILAGMHTNCRYYVRRAEKMHDSFEIVMNTEAARRDFLTLYNRFTRSKGNMPPLKSRRFNEYLPHGDVFILYFEGQPTCGHLVLRDKESRIALLLYSGTRRLERGADTQTVGSLNRYLHWHEMKLYQAAGMEKYDFGGIGSVNPSLSQFKKSFGGQSVMYHYGLYAGTAGIAWKLAHSLYTRWAGQARLFSNRSDELLTDCFEQEGAIRSLAER
jgi:hypothetical protein